MAIWRMRNTYWIRLQTHTCLDCVMHIDFPQQQGYTNALQYYIIHTLSVLLCHDFLIVLGMALKYFDNYMVLTTNLLTHISATLFQYACQSNLPSTVRVLVQIGFANIQARNSDTGNCCTQLDKLWAEIKALI